MLDAHTRIVANHQLTHFPQVKSNLQHISGILQAQSGDGDEGFRAVVSLLHDVAIDLVSLLQRLPQQLLNEGAKFVTLASEKFKNV